MPLIETVSLLTTLASAIQVLRSNKPGDPAPAASEAVEASGVVFGYDLARTHYESSVRRLDSSAGHFTLLAASTALATLASVLMVRAVNDEADLGSALIWASLVMTVAVVVGAVLVRALTSAQLISTRLALARQSIDAPLQLMEDYVRLAVSHADRNERSLSVRSLAGDLLLLCAAANVVILSIWALST